jgi:hypothetical protein
LIDSSELEERKYWHAVESQNLDTALVIAGEIVRRMVS